MKTVTILMILASFLTTSAFAAETTTECPWMKENNERNNPKANQSNFKKQPKQKSGAVSQ